MSLNYKLSKKCVALHVCVGGKHREHGHSAVGLLGDDHHDLTLR